MNKKILHSLSVVALGLMLVACDGGTGTTSKAPANKGTYTLKVGSYVDLDPENKNELKVELASAAVILNDQNKIVSAYFDVLQAPFAIDPTTKALSINAAATQTKDAGAKVIETKKELGDRYGMKTGNSAYGSSSLEWWEQTAKFEKYCLNKTIEDVTSKNYKNNYNQSGTEVVDGCTISQGNFVNALKNITDTKTFKAEANKVSAGVGTIINALDNNNVLTVTLAGSATDGTKVFETSINAYQIPLVATTATKDDATVDVLGLNLAKKEDDANAYQYAQVDPANLGTNPISEVASKRELKNKYGMSAINAPEGEWYVQADNFAKYAVKAAKASELTGQNYKTHYNPNGTVEVQGCSITMTEFAAAVAESTTLKSDLKAR